jgi:hypothetical protein
VEHILKKLREEIFESVPVGFCTINLVILGVNGSADCSATE